MKKNMKITLKPGERVYINGAVLCSDRKVTIELLNDVTFLLEHHVLKPEETTTPLRQLYFAVQTMIMDPSEHNPARAMCGTMLRDLLGSFSSQDIRAGLIKISGFIAKDRNFEALREIRTLLPVESKVLASVGSTTINHQETKDAGWRDREHYHLDATDRATA